MASYYEAFRFKIVISGVCRMGMLVWQDMPSMFYEDPFNAGISYRHPQEKAQHMHELQRMIEVQTPTRTSRLVVQI